MENFPSSSSTSTLSNNGNEKTKRKRGLNQEKAKRKRTSIYRGVTRHRWTGRYEAHLWDKGWNPIQNKKGRQVYLGGYDDEKAAARTYDLAALKYWGSQATLNFPAENYAKEYAEMQTISKEEYLASLRRRSNGFSRGCSKYRGVARHHQNGKWEARIGQVVGQKYLYLGTYRIEEEAARAYDVAAIHFRGPYAVTNFDISSYMDTPKPLPQAELPQPQPEPDQHTIPYAIPLAPLDSGNQTAITAGMVAYPWMLCMEHGIDRDTPKPLPQAKHTQPKPESQPEPDQHTIPYAIPLAPLDSGNQTAITAGMVSYPWMHCMEHGIDGRSIPDVVTAAAEKATDFYDFFNNPRFEDNVENLF